MSRSINNIKIHLFTLIAFHSLTAMWNLMTSNISSNLFKKKIQILFSWHQGMLIDEHVPFKEIMFPSKVQEYKLTNFAIPIWVMFNTSEMHFRTFVYQNEIVTVNHVYQVMFGYHSENHSINVKQHCSWYSQKPPGLANPDLISGTMLCWVVYSYS